MNEIIRNMFYYCPNCWKEIGKNTDVCPYCKADIKALDKEDYISQLIRSLHHPEPETPIRAATILGELKAEQSVDDLIHLFERTSDFYIQEACIRALGEIGNRTSIDYLKIIQDKNLPIIVRVSLEEILRKNEGTQEKNIN